jgi:guanylate kinase
MWTSDLQRRRGLILILSSPSGTGKSSLIQKIMTRDSDIRFSISVTTRPPRGEEQNGTAYTFVSEETFDTLRQDPDYFIEHAMCYGYQYGTPKKPIEEMLQSGKDIVMDISWEGAKIFLETMPQDVVTVFILPPSLERTVKAERPGFS